MLRTSRGRNIARAAHTPTAASASASQGKPPSLVRRSSSNSICRGSTTGLAITAGLVAGAGYMKVSLGLWVGFPLYPTQETLLLSTFLHNSCQARAPLGLGGFAVF